jgi:hypothetical protein
MSNVIDYLYTNILYNPFMKVENFFVSEKYGPLVLLAIIVIVAIVQSKFQPRLKGKKKYLSQLITVFILTLIFLLAIVVYDKYQTQITNFFKTSNTAEDQTKPDTNTKKTTPSQTTAPSTNYTQPKQLYYSVSCSGCYANGCPSNGYNYGGYLESYYLYYKGLCQACSCTSYKAVSFWK